MKLLCFRLFATLLTAFSVAAQTQPQSTPTLSNYLSLTPDQAKTIAANNAEYNLTARAKQERLAQVQAEIVQETARQTLSVAAIGERYVELETVCRELTEAGRSQRARNLGALNDQQKARLTALEEAIRLAAVARTAQVSLLLTPPQSMSPLIFAVTNFDEQGAFAFFDFPATFPMCRLSTASASSGSNSVLNRRPEPQRQ
ncbi:MAG: hypothetical protein U0Q16_00760 [Bryobacteraceae bacterium]